MVNPIRILSVFGTRPEAIKMAPVVQALAKNPNFQSLVCLSGQHREMLRPVMETFQLQADYDLAIMQQGQTLFDITTRLLERFKAVLDDAKPDAVLVHGDTSTAFVAGLGSFYQQIPVGHVEAGLRTGDIYSPFPEEFNRQALSLFAKWHFAPTEKARQNLLKESKDPNSIVVTGNTALDALQTTVRPDWTHPILDWIAGRRLLLLTCHRRENLGKPMREIFLAIRDLLSADPSLCVVYPIHLNPSIRGLAQEIFQDCDALKLIEPMEVFDFHNLMAKAHLILTDSGGIQEEAPSLHVPVLVLREHTERPEGLAAGTLKLVGTDRQTICQATQELLHNPSLYAQMRDAENPYGDGHAAERIVAHLQKELSSQASNL